MLFKKKHDTTDTLELDFLSDGELTGDDTDDFSAKASDTDDIDNIGANDSGMNEAGAEKPPKKKLPFWVIFPILGVMLAATFGLWALFGNQDSASDMQTLSVVEVQKGNIRQVYNSSGTIESENTKTYYAPVTAPIANLNAEVGKAVKKGDLLVTFDTTNLERDNQQAQLTLKSSYNTSQAARDQNAKAIDAANAANAELANQANALAEQANELKARADAAKAEYDANAAQNASPEIQNRISELRTQIQASNAQIQETQNTIETLSVIYQGSGAAYSDALATPEAERSPEQKQLIQNIDRYNEAVALLPTLQSQAAGLQSELDSLTTVADTGYAELYAQYEAVYAQWEAAYNAANGASAPSGMSNAEAENLDISDNLAELAALTPAELLEKGREGMKADMDGVIASVEVLQSNSAAQGAAVFSIASTENVRVKIEVSPDDYAKMKVGSAATITVGDHKYEGTLSNINKIAVNNAKGNPVISARIHITNPDENLCIGATAKVSMTVAKSDNVLVIPTEAVNASTDGNFVFVIKDNVVHKQPVELGNTSTTHVEIISGLKEGEHVVNDLNVDLAEGMKAVGILDTGDEK